jgi:hypothetical protein
VDNPPACVGTLSTARTFVSVGFRRPAPPSPRRLKELTAESWPDIGDALRAIRVPCSSPLPVIEGMHEAAARLAAQYGLDIDDALSLTGASCGRCSEPPDVSGRPTTASTG